MQSDIAVQPGETSVTAALRALARVAGWCVVHTTDGAHVAASLHYCGRAVDLAARSGPGTDTDLLLAINEQVIQLLPLSMISELIYAGRGGICVKNGKVVSGAAVYGATTLAEHHNHVHLGVVPSFTYHSAAAGAAPPPAPLAPSSQEVTGVKITAGTIPVAALDDQGHGWVSIPAPIARILFIGTQGSAPARDNAYWAPVSWTVNDSGTETIVDLYGLAHQATLVYYSILDEA